MTQNSILDISPYIQDLLWQHDCVIIPDLGGILGSYYGAQIHYGENTLYPPSKSLAFNESLTSNDGLLANHISQKNQITYGEANQIIRDWVLSVKALLADRQSVALHKIGHLKFNSEKHILFTQDPSFNYLITSYGLPTVNAEPVAKERQLQRVAATTHCEDESIEKPITNNKWLLAAMVMLLLSLGLIINLMTSDVTIPALNLSTASVWSMIDRYDPVPEINIEPRAILENTPPASITDIEIPKPINTDTAPVATDNFEKVKDEILETTAPVEDISLPEKNDFTAPEHRPHSKKVETPASTKKYYVIVGAFRSPQNIEKAQEMIKSNFNKPILYHDTLKSVVRVGFLLGEDSVLSSISIKEIKKEHPKFWVLER